jgi:hypothetical protein
MKTKLLGVAAALTLLATANSAYAVSVTQVMTTVNLAASTVDTTGPYGQQTNSFQFYIGTTLSFFPNGSIIRGEEIHYGGGIPIRDATGSEPNPPSGGWGPVRGTVPFTLSNNILDFVVSFAVLNEPTGQFSYLFGAYSFGATTQQFSGTSDGGIASVYPPVPLPAALPLFATGLGALGLLGWRRKRKAAAQVAA